MSEYCFREASDDNVGRIVEIYNSNIRFLENHLDSSQIDAMFIHNEMAEMKSVGFLSCVITEEKSGQIVGIVDYKPENEVYLSLMMLHADFQNKGKGSEIYKIFEENMIHQKKSSIRIDVVNDYGGNVMPFWEKLGFQSEKEIQLTWGNKTSSAVVMKKSLKKD